jgi:endonuclease YncB( thermonuclease family)
MPFTLIKGTFRLVNKTKTGNPTGFEPDGDSMQFLPNNAKLLDQLTQLMSPYRLTAIGSVQLRFEGIDALEIHFLPGGGLGSTHQPRPLADDARDALTADAKLDPVDYAEPRLVRVKPPAPNDGASGYILARSLDVHGRPVAFAFQGRTSDRDGSAVHLTPARLRKSLNHGLLEAGQAYPLFYDTLFYDLRDELASVAADARKAKRGVWKQDLTQKGTPATTIAKLEASAVVFPKLFRRVAEYIGEGNSGLTDFKQWVADKKERVFDLDTTNNTHFDTYLDVANGKVAMTKDPSRLVFVSAKGRAPWL